MKKTNYLAKQKRTVYLILIFILGCILVLSFFLNTYLLKLQRKERLEKIGDIRVMNYLMSLRKDVNLKKNLLLKIRLFILIV